jgi:O-methyltransferase
LSRRVRSALRRGLHRVGLDVVRWSGPTEHLDHGADLEPAQRETLSKVMPYTMTSPARIVALVDAVEYIHRAQVPGAVVECGVWKGGSMMAAALTLLRLGDHRDLFLYDTFEGMTEPTAHDVDVNGRKAADLLREQARTTSAESIWCYAPLQGVRDAIRSTGYPEPLVHFVAGPVEATIPRTVPDRISVLRLDTDWYESTRHELEHLYPLLQPGGVLIIDDYGHHLGCRKATDEYFARLPEPVLLSRIDYTGRLTVKR